MDRTDCSYMGLTQANTSKQDESRSLAAVPMVDGGGPDGTSHCDPHVPASAWAIAGLTPELSEFVYAPIGSQNNGMTLSVLSALT
jgi:hypothetical protein